MINIKTKTILITCVSSLFIFIALQNLNIFNNSSSTQRTYGKFENIRGVSFAGSDHEFVYNVCKPKTDICRLTFYNALKKKGFQFKPPNGEYWSRSFYSKASKQIFFIVSPMNDKGIINNFKNTFASIDVKQNKVKYYNVAPDNYNSIVVDQKSQFAYLPYVRKHGEGWTAGTAIKGIYRINLSNTKRIKIFDGHASYLQTLKPSNDNLYFCAISLYDGEILNQSPVLKDGGFKLGTTNGKVSRFEPNLKSTNHYLGQLCLDIDPNYGQIHLRTINENKGSITQLFIMKNSKKELLLETFNILDYKSKFSPSGQYILVKMKDRSNTGSPYDHQFEFNVINRISKKLTPLLPPTDLQSYTIRILEQ